MKILLFEDGPAATIGYLLVDEEAAKAMLIDCPIGSGPHILAELAKRNVTLETIVITHGHWDHTGDVAQVAAATKAPVLIHADDAHWLENPMGHFGYPGINVPGMPPDRFIAEGDDIVCGSMLFRVIHVPGHSLGSVVLHEEAKGLLFTGDVVFEASIGRTDLYGGDFDTLIHGIRTKIFTLPDDTRVYPGHGDSTTIGAEKAGNPFFG